MGDLINSPFVQFILVMLLALLPAYMLGRFLPSEADVKGPFRGLTISFTGSFALYIVIILLGGSMISGFYALDDRYAVVTVHGRLILEGASQEGIRSHQVGLKLHPIRIARSPPTSNTVGFSVSVAARRTSGKGYVMDSDHLIVEYPGYVSQDLTLRPADISALGVISVGDVVLAPAPPEFRQPGPVQD